MSASDDKLANARSQAMAQYESISEMVGNLRAADDDDAYEEIAPYLAKEAGFEVIGGGNHWCWRSLKDGAAYDADEYETEEEAWLACCNDNSLRPDREDAERAIHEDALSVEVRSDWHEPGGDNTPGEFTILLCTGGPAVRIVGELDRGEPSRAWLECQDWFTSWTQVHGPDQDVLLAYARCFYFGE